MPAPNASLVQIFDAMSDIEWATLNDAALGAGQGIKKAYKGMPGKISDTMLPCTVRWPSEGAMGFGTEQDTPIGSDTPAPIHEQYHTVVVGVVIGKRDNSLTDLSREAARWINLLPEKAYIPNQTLGHIVHGVAVKRYAVLEMPIGAQPYIVVTWPIVVSVTRSVVSRQ